MRRHSGGMPALLVEGAGVGLDRSCTPTNEVTKQRFSSAQRTTRSARSILRARPGATNLRRVNPVSVWDDGRLAAELTLRDNVVADHRRLLRLRTPDGDVSRAHVARCP